MGTLVSAFDGLRLRGRPICSVPAKVLQQWLKTRPWLQRPIWRATPAAAYLTLLQEPHERRPFRADQIFLHRSNYSSHLHSRVYLSPRRLLPSDRTTKATVSCHDLEPEFPCIWTSIAPAGLLHVSNNANWGPGIASAILWDSLPLPTILCATTSTTNDIDAFTTSFAATTLWGSDVLATKR